MRMDHEIVQPDTVRQVRTPQLRARANFHQVTEYFTRCVVKFTRTLSTKEEKKRFTRTPQQPAPGSWENK